MRNCFAEAGYPSVEVEDRKVGDGKAVIPKSRVRPECLFREQSLFRRIATNHRSLLATEIICGSYLFHCISPLVGVSR